ncbi:MAG: hypothetical protein WC873_03770 [Candidatus Gracilibacteria bacterium]
MFATSGDVLNMALAIGFIILVIFLCIFLFYAILIARDASRVTEDIEEIVSRVHSTIVEPLKAVDFIFEKVRPYIEMTVDRVAAKAKAAKKRK